MRLAELLLTFIAVVIDLGILWYVKREYEESAELNKKLDKVYRSKKRKNALVKAIINAPVEIMEAKTE